MTNDWMIIPQDVSKDIEFTKGPDEDDERLAWMQEKVGGFIQRIPQQQSPSCGSGVEIEFGIIGYWSFPPTYLVHIWVDEEGLLKSKQLNHRASTLFETSIVGDVLVEVEINE